MKKNNQVKSNLIDKSKFVDRLMEKIENYGDKCSQNMCFVWDYEPDLPECLK